MPRAIRVNNLEIKVLNYLIYNAIRNVEHNEINWESIGNDRNLRGRVDLWKGIYGSIKAQLKMNPNDVDGFSITPVWVRTVYQKYRNSDIHDMWNPDGINLESVPNMKKDTISVSGKKIETSDPSLEYLGYTNGDDFTLHLISTGSSEEYLRGYFDAVDAKKVYKVKLEELNVI